MGEFFSKQIFRKEYKMNMSKLALMALLATGTVFAFTGCGDKKDDAKEEDKAEKKASDPAKELVDKFIKGIKDKDLKAVQSYLPEDKQPISVDDLKEAEAIFSSFKYEKTVKVNDKYSLVCGTITDPEEGNTKFAFHVKNGKIVDGEDNWEPKDKHK